MPQNRSAAPATDPGWWTPVESPRRGRLRRPDRGGDPAGVAGLLEAAAAQLRPAVVVVGNRKSSGKTTSALLLGDALARVRGQGSVLAVEVGQYLGDLVLRAHGTPRRGLVELLEVLAAGPGVATVDPSDYTAHQPSGLEVLGGIAGGSAWNTAVSLGDLLAAVQATYPLTVLDTGNDPRTGLFQDACAQGGVLVVTVTCTTASIRAAQDTIRAAGAGPAQVVVIANHDGGFENPQMATGWVQWLETGLFLDTAGPVGSCRVVEVGYDPAIRDDTHELDLASLDPTSRLAWLVAAAAVVDVIVSNQTASLMAHKGEPA